MTANLLLIVVMAVLFACGVYLLLERSLTRILLGFLLTGNAVNLLLLVIGGAPGLPPFVGNGEPEQQSDPLPQALTLTAIVITFAVSSFLLALIYRSWRIARADAVTDDAEDRELDEDATAETDDSGPDTDDSEFGDASDVGIATAAQTGGRR